MASSTPVSGRGRERSCRNSSAPGAGSRGPSGRTIMAPVEPRESACGLIPGLESPGPFGPESSTPCARRGQCYSFRQLPTLGGIYGAENRMVFPIREHFGAWGSVQRAPEPYLAIAEASTAPVEPYSRVPEDSAATAEPYAVIPEASVAATEASATSR